jgi:hypothetical protein
MKASRSSETPLNLTKLYGVTSHDVKFVRYCVKILHRLHIFRCLHIKIVEWDVFDHVLRPFEFICVTRIAGYRFQTKYRYNTCLVAAMLFYTLQNISRQNETVLHKYVSILYMYMCMYIK